ncbi:MAG TPA: lysylphosphatidylglycerol synthase transmembrane domain-containing protein [Acidimicrobiia bacterium]|nr:lysylphosphatidylglycerol synthase transmembrane domain-containing protein [Acidimicrobiia bacterium]
MSVTAYDIPALRTDVEDRTRGGAPPAASGRHATMRLSALLRWVLLAAAIAFMSRSIAGGWPEITQAVEALSSRDAAWLVIVVLIEAAWVVTLAQVYRSSLIAFGGSARHREALRVSMGAFTLSRVLPGGGAVGALLAAREFVRVGNGGPVTLLALVTAGWVSLVTLTTGVAIGIGVGLVSGLLSPGLLFAPGAILAVLVTVGAVGRLAVRSPHWRRRLFGIMERVFSRWAPDMTREELEAALVNQSRVRIGSILQVGGWSAIGWVLDATALWMVFAIFGQQLDLGVLSVGYGIANLIQALPELTPGWLGVLEGSLSLTYAGFGVPLATGMLAVLGYRLVSFWLPVLAGVPHALSIVGIRRRRHMERGE